MNNKQKPAKNFTDIETGPRSLESMLEVAGEFDPSDVALGNTTDPKKIADKIADARADYPAKLTDRGFCDPMLGMVVAIGIHFEDDTQIILDAAADERLALRTAWQTYSEIRHGGIEGWNLFGFDMDFLRLRSLILGVPVPDWVYSVLPSGQVTYTQHYSDSMLKVTGSPRKYLKLDTFARAIGLKGKNGNGKEFAGLWTSGDPEKRAKATEYLQNDLTQTAGVGRHLARAVAGDEVLAGIASGRLTLAGGATEADEIRM